MNFWLQLYSDSGFDINSKVLEDLMRFPTSTYIANSEVVWGRYDFSKFCVCSCMSDRLWCALIVMSIFEALGVRTRGWY